MKAKQDLAERVLEVLFNDFENRTYPLFTKLDYNNLITDTIEDYERLGCDLSLYKIYLRSFEDLKWKLKI